MKKPAAREFNSESEKWAAFKTALEQEVVVLNKGKFNPVVLIEDELIVSLPIIPRHVDISECGSIAETLVGFAPDH